MRCIILLVLATVYIQSCIAVCVNTQEGKLSGVELKSRNGKKIFAYNGIPYAEPPIGPLSFKSPVPKKPWKHTWRAHNDHCECLQERGGKIHGKEDCLYLNVFSPEIKPAKPRPVMVHIHGGVFESGNASLITSGPQFLLDGDVVVVTCNYRLGVLGFLSTGNESAPGNFGIKDIVLVLQWVQKNIHAFGGDPKDVTLFGQDSGAIIVHLLTLVERAKPLYKRVIMQSGGCLNPQSFASHPSYYEKSKKVAEICKCPTTNPDAMMDCLRRVDRTTLITASVFDQWDMATRIKWRPTIEPLSIDSVLTSTPEKSIRNEQMKDCPMITGNVKIEVPYMIKYIAAKKELYDECVNNPVGVIKRMLEYYDPITKTNVDELAKKVKNYYLGEKLPKEKHIVLYKYALLLSDLFFHFPQQQFTDYMVEVQAELAYSYRFKYRGAISLAIPLEKDLKKCDVVHGDDQFYLFPLTSKVIGPQYNIQRTEKDYEIVDIMVDLWTSFSKTSKPTSPRLHGGIQWKELKSEEWLQIGSGVSNTTITLRKESHSSRIKFWYDNAPLYSLTCS